MEIAVNGTRLWFDVEGAALVPDGAGMAMRPSLLLVHGGPGGYDHSYFKPHFAALARVAQVVFVALLLAARHPDLAGGLVAQSTMARFDLERLAAGVRRVAGDEVAELARRDYAGDLVSDDEWARIFAAFGPVVPDGQALARRIRNPELGLHGMNLMRRLDLTGELARVRCPVLVSVGALDAVTPVEAAREIAAALPPGLGRLDVLEGAGHFPWLDRPDAYWTLLSDFVASPRR